MRRRVRYALVRVRFLWRLNNSLGHRVLCILGLRYSPSWAMVAAFHRHPLEVRRVIPNSELIPDKRRPS